MITPSSPSHKILQTTCSFWEIQVPCSYLSWDLLEVWSQDCKGTHNAKGISPCKLWQMLMVALLWLTGSSLGCGGDGAVLLRIEIRTQLLSWVIFSSVWHFLSLTLPCYSPLVTLFIVDSVPLIFILLYATIDYSTKATPAVLGHFCPFKL